MEEQVTYRAYEERDFAAVVRLIEDVWDYEAVGSAQLARHLAELDLMDVLRTRSFSQVALLDGAPVGFIFGERTGTPCDPRYDFRTRQARRGLRRQPLGLFLSALDRQLDRINRKLLKRSGNTYDAQLSYFALREDCRGRGVGAALYEAFRQAMARQGAETFCVYTDTASSYGFYEHMGMVRRAVYSFKLPLWQEGGTDFYLYDGVCGEQEPGGNA